MVRAATFAALVALVSPVHADSMQGIVRGAVQRARRSVAIGPVVGGAVAYLPSPAKLEYPISFGVGLDLFAIPIVPDLDQVREVVVERTKARVTERVQDIVKNGGRAPQGDELAALARELGQEVA